MPMFIRNCTVSQISNLVIIHTRQLFFPISRMIETIMPAQWSLSVLFCTKQNLSRECRNGDVDTKGFHYWLVKLHPQGELTEDIYQNKSQGEIKEYTDLISCLQNINWREIKILREFSQNSQKEKNKRQKHDEKMLPNRHPQSGKLN